MNRKLFLLVLGLAGWTTAVPLGAMQPPPRAAGDRAAVLRSAEQWVRQLENELDHLEEDLHYKRGSYPEGLAEQLDQAARTAAGFRQTLRREPSPSRLMREFQQLDQQIHLLVSSLEQSNDGWLRRQASRIRYPDEQLHFVLQTMIADPRPTANELLGRHTLVLAREARNLQELVRRVARRDDPLRDAVGEFADVTEHFHQSLEGGADLGHLNNDFGDIDETWQAVVEQINRSPYGLYLRRNAQNVNRVHNQIHNLLTTTPVPPQQVTPPAQAAAPPQAAPPRSRPAIEFEIPGIGRFRIPR